MEMVDPHRPSGDPHWLGRRRANRNDSVLLAPTLDDAAKRGLLTEIETLWLDRGYDSNVTREPSPNAASMTRSSRESESEEQPRARRASRWGCVGQWSARIPVCRTSAGCGGTRIEGPCTVSLNLPLPSRSCS